MEQQDVQKLIDGVKQGDRDALTALTQLANPPASADPSVQVHRDALTALMDLARTGHRDALTALTNLAATHGEEIRRCVRRKLAGRRLTRVYDSMDVYNSMLRKFFIGVAAGKFHLKKAGDLPRLLVKMAKNKVEDYHRCETADCRGGDWKPAPEGLIGLIAPTLPPDKIAEDKEEREKKEMFEKVLQRMTEAERYLVEQRRLGRSWADLGAERGKKPDALKKSFSRAVERAAFEMGLEASHD